MRNRIWSGTFAAIVGAAAVTLAAQTTTPQTPTPSSSSSDKKITVTGCLQAAPPTAPDTTTGTSGTTGTAGTATGTAGTAGTTGAAGTTTAPAAGAGQTYRLIANPTALSPHVGKKVELTGTLVQDAASSAGTSTTTSSQSAMASGPALKVEAGKVLTAP